MKKLPAHFSRLMSSNSPTRGSQENRLPAVTSIRRESVSFCTSIYLVLTSLQFLSMLLLTSQQTGMPFLVRSATKESHFLPTTSVFMMEVLKTTTCCIIIFYYSSGSKEFFSKLYTNIIVNKTETLKVSVPALVYAIQNNLYYVALANIDATTYSVTYQLRILTTAVLVVCLLNKQLSSAQWGALLISLAGVVLVQLDQSKSHTSSSAVGNNFIGVAATISMCWTSAFAGVYFEKMLKNPSADMWIQNLRLSLITLAFSFVTMVVNDGERIASAGLFQGWTNLVWLITVINSVGGLAVSLVMKYADNVKKTYCQTIAIGLTALISIGIGERLMSAMLSCGVFLVIVSVYIYSFYPPSQLYKPLPQETDDKELIEERTHEIV